MRNPCKKCEERHVGCHASCEKYMAFYEQNRKIDQKRHQATKLNIYVAEAVISTKSGRNGSWKAYRNKEESPSD